MVMTRRDWWLGVALIVLAILVHAAVPRYEWRNLGERPVFRIDRWTGTMEVGTFTNFRWAAMPPDAARTPAVQTR